MSAKIYVGSVSCFVFSYSTIPRLSCFEIQTDCGFRSINCSNLSWNTTDDTLRDVSDFTDAEAASYTFFPLVYLTLLNLQAFSQYGQVLDVRDLSCFTVSLHDTIT